MIACDSYLSLFFFTLQKKLRSGAIVRFSDNSSLNIPCNRTFDICETNQMDGPFIPLGYVNNYETTRYL